jgi:iron(II)-dependent oxidoreductase
MTVSEKSEIAERLSSLHASLIKQFSAYKEQDLCTQYHPDLSQLGWHLNHVAFIEQYWLREVVLGDDSRTRDFHQYYFPELIEKTGRGLLSDLTNFDQLQNSFSDTEQLWLELSAAGSTHVLMQKNYMGWFLLQHGEQHLETMQMVLQQRALTKNSEQSFTAVAFDPQGVAAPDMVTPAGEYLVGSAETLACDNEQAIHTETLSQFLIASKPVSNAEYLGFIHDDAYQCSEYWTDNGWLWKTKSTANSPEQWLQDGAGNWYELSAGFPVEIKADAAVSGLSWYEANAFASYAGYRLPHEFEWEVAMKLKSDLFASTGQAWEWCANTFFPYDGFRAYPYERYSTPWFDGLHYTLKGSSPHSGECVRSPTFRNFYQPAKRHIFAGTRLVSDG